MHCTDPDAEILLAPLPAFVRGINSQVLLCIPSHNANAYRHGGVWSPPRCHRHRMSHLDSPVDQLARCNHPKYLLRT